MKKSLIALQMDRSRRLIRKLRRFKRKPMMLPDNAIIDDSFLAGVAKAASQSTDNETLKDLLK